MANYHKCHSCGSWVPRGDSECPHCGTDQLPTPLRVVRETFANLFPKSSRPAPRTDRLCVSCNRLVGEADVECPHCGIKQTAWRRVLKKMQSSSGEGQSASWWLLAAIATLFVLPMVAGGGDFDFRGYLVSGDQASGVRMGALTRNVVLVGDELKIPTYPDAFVPTPDMAYADAIKGGQYWRLVTAIFLHWGVMHIVFNAMALLYLGPSLEELYGRHWFLVLYLVTGVVGFVASYYAAPVRVSAGASGAIFGLIAAGLVYTGRHRARNAALFRLFASWLFIGFFFGLAIGADNWAHGGGALAGAALGFVITPEKATGTRRARRIGQVLGYLSVVIMVGSFVLAGLWARG